jgi:hypothetical protein
MPAQGLRLAAALGRSVVRRRRLSGLLTAILDISA